MLKYLDKFKDLEEKLKAVVSSPQALEKINILEQKYQVDLAGVIIKIMIKEINFKNLPLILGLELGLKEKQASLLIEDLKKDIFFPVFDYLGLKPKIVSEDQGLAKAEKKDLTEQKTNFWAKEVFRILNFKLNDPKKDLELIKLLEKYLRGIKGRYATREILTINQASGGFGLTDKMVDNIFMIIQSLVEKDEQRIKASSRLDASVLSNINQLKHGLIAPQEKPLMIPSEPDVFHLPSPMRELDQESLTLPVLSPVEEEESEPEPEPEPEPKPPVVSSNLQPSGGKVPMTDVRKVKITGPIDEIRYLDLLNFRRLSSDPQEALKKVAQKLKVLEGIDYGKMIEGIKAWRQSPVNRLYLKMFFRASNESVTLDEIIKDLKDRQEDYLTREELDTIIEFNRELIF